MAKKELGLDLDFDFDDFDVEDLTPEALMEEDTTVLDDDNAYDELLDLNGEQTSLAVDITYPYLRIAGMRIADEVKFMSNNLTALHDKVVGRYREDEMLSVTMNIDNEDYIITKLPLTLDTMLEIMKSHRYDVSLVTGVGESTPITSELMKAFMFT